MTGLFVDGNEPPGSSKALYNDESTFQFCGKVNRHFNPWRYSPCEGPRPTSRLLASRSHAEAEVDDHPIRMEVSCG
ncbi:hypothetical protein ANN_13314 [Periplaneta americana]|uniref:Uncharacterized protein n=1 Tax=Periplaneta americana TaxID=6978 RepID=A0ABQ8TKV3_PERAM|nr:hypothetical protein ANN_13314 [Periplaneta americana]